MSRRPTPNMIGATDIMSECMGASESTSNKAIKQESNKAVYTAIPSAVNTASNKSLGSASSTRPHPAIKQESNKAIKQDGARKSKVTFNLTVEIQERLEAAWFLLKRSKPGTRITKTLIVEEALRIVLDEYDKQGDSSQLAESISHRD